MLPQVTTLLTGHPEPAFKHIITTIVDTVGYEGAGASAQSAPASPRGGIQVLKALLQVSDDE